MAETVLLVMNELGIDWLIGAFGVELDANWLTRVVCFREWHCFEMFHVLHSSHVLLCRNLYRTTGCDVEVWVFSYSVGCKFLLRFE